MQPAGFNVGLWGLRISNHIEKKNLLKNMQFPSECVSHSCTADCTAEPLTTGSTCNYPRDHINIHIEILQHSKTSTDPLKVHLPPSFEQRVELAQESSFQLAQYATYGS